MGATLEASADERIAQVQAQAKSQVGDVALGEQIANVSHYGSMAAGAGIAAKTGGWVGLATYAAGVGAGKAGAWLADKLGVADKLANGLESFGMHRIGQGGPHPAAKGHQVAHSHAFGGFLATLVIGAVVAVAVGAAIVASGGLAAVALIGAAAAGGGVMGFLGSALGGAMSKLGTKTGPITSGSPDVFIEGRPAARMTDTVACSKDGGVPQPIIEGSETIFVNGLPLARIGHNVLCGAIIDEGAMSVFMDESVVACARPAPEISVQARVLGDLMGFLPLGRVSGYLGNKVRSNTNTTSAQATGTANCNAKCASDPVNVATGQFVDWRTDISIPSVLPIEWRRFYASGGEQKPGFHGARWLDSWSIQLLRERLGAETIDFHDEEGVVLTFHTPSEVIHAEHLRTPDLILRGTRQSPELWNLATGIRSHFAWQGNTARLVAYSDACGNRCDFIYHADGRLRALHHSEGWRVELLWLHHHTGGHQPQHQLRSVWLHEPDGHSVELARYSHDPQGRLTHCASLHSGRTHYRYDEQDRITDWGDDTHTQVHIRYYTSGEAQGRVHSVQTPGHIHSGCFAYDLQRRVTHVCNTLEPHADTPYSAYTYNADNLVTCERDPLGHETHTEWDRHHRVLSTTDALGRVTQFEHDDAGRLVRITDPRGHIDTWAYNEQDQLVESIAPHGQRVLRSYDARGLLVSQTHAQGDEPGITTRFEHDAQGRLRYEHLPSGGVVQHHVDEHHRPCGHTAPNGAHTAWQQNRLGTLRWITDPLQATTTFEYTPAQTWGDGVDFANTCTPAAHEQQTHDPNLAPRANAHRQPTRITQPDGHVLIQSLNREGLVEAHTNAAGHTQHWNWGAFDLLQEHTDTAGHSTRYTYGSEGRLSQLTNAAGQHWRWQFDAAGQLSEEIDYSGRRTRWQRDALGRPLQRTQADGTLWHYDWDEADRLRALTAPDVRHAYRYDEHDRLIVAQVWRRTTPKASNETLESDLRFEYDAQGRLSAETHRCGAECGDDKSSQPERRISYQHNALGQLIARSSPLGETRYAFDTQGLLQELHTAHGAVHIERDARGQTTERASLPSHHPQRQAAQAPGYHAYIDQQPSYFHLHQHHDSMGRLVQQSVTPQHSGSQLYNAAVNRRYHWQANRLSSVQDERFGHLHFKLDEREHIVQAYNPCGGHVPAPHTLSAHPLAPIGSPHEEHFGYDPLGNLQSIDLNPSQFDGDVITAQGRSRYRHDALGRLIERTQHKNGFRPQTWHYGWDSFNRLISVQTPEGRRWRYTYDALGRRRAKHCDQPPPPRSKNDPWYRPLLKQAEYLWDGPQVAAQWKTYADGTRDCPGSHFDQIQEWHYEPQSFTPIALVHHRQGHTQLCHVVADLNDAPREILDQEGHMLWAGQLSTWGSLVRCDVKDRDTRNFARYTPSSRPPANDPWIDIDLRFSNQWADEESGLYYNLNRHYDPSCGQYASQDPLGPVEGGVRTHGYVHNPITWVDPLGLNSCAVGAGKPPITRDPYSGVRNASAYLRDQGVPRAARKQILESFDIRTIQVRQAGASEYGLRYFDGVTAQPRGRYLFETFPASRASLALDPQWNAMTHFSQWQIRPGATLLEGVASPQGFGLPGGQIQKFVPNLGDLLLP